MLLDLVEAYLMGKHIYVQQAFAQMYARGDSPPTTSKDLMLPAIVNKRQCQCDLVRDHLKLVSMFPL